MGPSLSFDKVYQVLNRLKLAHNALEQ